MAILVPDNPLKRRLRLPLGEKTAGLINVFNPELVVVGGELAMTGACLIARSRYIGERFEC